MVKKFLLSRYFAPLLLALIISAIYYQFFIFGKVPFPGDLLVVSYSPWFDYYKFPVQNPLISDVFSQFFLWKYLAVDILKSWQWPLWNPYSFTGTPLLATYHSGALYPLNLFLFLPKYFGWGLYIYSQTLIASITFYLFISQITKSKFARLSGAIIFSLGGLMTTWLELGTAVHAMAWVPLSLYSVKRFSETLKFRFILMLTTALFLMVLAGNAQVATYSYLVTIFYSIFLNWKKQLNVKIISFLFFAILISIFSLTFQLLPSLDLFQKSIRQTESYTAQSNYGLLDIKDLFKLFIADYFGNPVTRNYWGNLNYSETSGFLSILTLPLLIYALFKLRGREPFFFSILLAVSLLLAFDNPISSYIYQLKIPLLTSSYASRMLFITLFSVSTLSALAINHAVENKNSRFLLMSTFYSWAGILGIILGTLLTYFFVWDILGWAPSDKHLKVYLESSDYALQNFIIAFRNSFIPFTILSFFLLFSFILNILKKRFIQKNKLYLLFSLILILLAFDLGRYFLKFNPFVSNDLIFPKTPALEFLQKQNGYFRVGREHAEVFPPNTWIAYNLQSYEGYDPIYLNQYGKFMHFLNGGDLRTGNSSRYAEISSSYSSPYLDAANTKFFIAVLRDQNGHIPGDSLHYRVKDTNYKIVFKDKSAAILENLNALDRVYFAPSILILPESKIEDVIMDDPEFDPRKVIALSKDLSINSVTGKGIAKVSYYSPNLIKINTETDSEEVLVLVDQHEEGWNATIDNRPTDISPVNLIFRAIKIPSGSHEIVFRYWPKSFDIGLKISLVSSLIIFCVSLFTIKFKEF